METKRKAKLKALGHASKFVHTAKELIEHHFFKLCK